MARPTLYRTIVCLSVLSVCDVGVLLPNGWMDQDETLRGRPRPGHVVLDGVGPAPPKGGSAPNFCPRRLWRNGRWIKIGLPLRTYGGRPRPGNLVLDGDGDPAPPQKGAQLPQFSAHIYCGQTAGCIRYDLVEAYGV